MKPRVFAIAAILAVGILSAVPSSAAPPCDRKPNHPRCLTASPSPVPPTVAPTAGTPRLTFGLGSQTESAITSPLTLSAPVKILSNWYNGPHDLGWITDDHHQRIYADAKSRGYRLHLITWTNVPEAPISGKGCGRAYPVSAGWPDDIVAVVDAMRPEYVTLMTEFQTYACVDNRWSGNEAYWQALIANFAAVTPRLRALGSKVSIGWGGWQAYTDRTLEPAFLALDEDFRSFQAMHGVSNVEASRAMTKLLGPGPVMQAHHMPDADSNPPEVVYATFAEDFRQLFGSEASVQSLVADGLFAWSIVDDKGWSEDPDTFALVRDAIIRWGR